MLYRVLKAISPGRMIVALLLSVVIWGYVITTQYPEDSIPVFNVPIQTINLPANLIIRQISPLTATRVNLNGAKDKVTLVQFSAVQPVLDLANCKPGTCEIKIKLKQTPDNVSSYTIEPDIAQVQIEELIARDLAIEKNVIGTVRLGYQQDEIKLSANTITVKGPKSLVDRAVKAQVTINLDDRDTNLSGTAPIIVLDSAGQTLNNKDKSFQIDPETVGITASVKFGLNTKTVPVRVSTIGQPASGFIAGSSITTEPNIVTLNADPTVLDPIKYIETNPIDLTNATSDIITTTELQIPRNVAIIGSTSVRIRIGITVAQASVPVEVRYLVINPPPNNLRYEVRPGPTVGITLQGPYQLLQPKLPLDQIQATVDLAGLREGTHEVLLDVKTPPGLVATNLPKMTVIILAAPRPTSTPIPPAPTATAAPVPTATPVATTPPATATVLAEATSAATSSGPVAPRVSTTPGVAPKAEITAQPEPSIGTAPQPDTKNNPVSPKPTTK